MDSTQRDEMVSERAATAIMGVATVFTFVSWLLGTDPFTRVFDLLIVYLPTSVLVGWIIVQHFTRVAGSTPENKAA